jgi:large subunit ribosomal protein L35e
LRVSKVSSQPQVKLTKIKQVRKNIAKVLTVLSEKRISAARTEFKKKRYTPVDLRQKKNRAFRRKLTPFEANKMTVRGAKKAANSKVRKYALAA